MNQQTTGKNSMSKEPVCTHPTSPSQNEYIVLMQHADAEADRSYYTLTANDPDHAEEQALDENPNANAIAVYARVR